MMNTPIRRANFILVVLIVIIIGIFSIIVTLIHGAAVRSNIENTNNTIKNNKNEVFLSKDSTWHNKTESILISRGELKYIEDLKNLHKDFYEIKSNLKNLKSYSLISETTRINKSIILKDTVIYVKDSIPIKLKKFDFISKWDSITGFIINDSLNIKIFHKDSLEIVRYWDRKWFLGKKKNFVEIKSLNKNTKIEYQKDIESKRKRGLFKS